MAAPKLERYEILEELGQGGMSVVYRARDKQLGRDVAVKVLHDFMAKQPEAKKRFSREAVAVAKLHHPSIVEIFDYSGPEAQDSYIVTELLEGQTLRSFVETHAVPHPEIGALIAVALARALQHAHAEGVIHRDLKPENVMVTKTGALKLMDFGIAQVADGARVTVTGTLLGSPAHMAPEVIDGKRADARSDLFSLGTILYWLATGRLPFEGSNTSTLFKRILDGDYRHPQMVEPKIGNSLARIMTSLLEANLEQRCRDSNTLIESLEKELASVGLVQPEAELKAYLLDPLGFVETFQPRLTAQLLEAARAAVKDRDIGKATDRLNRVLAVDPDHEEAMALLTKLGRRQETRRRLQQGSAFFGMLLALVGAAYGAIALAPDPALEPPPKTSVSATGPEVPVPAVAKDVPPSQDPRVPIAKSEDAEPPPRGKATSAVILAPARRPDRTNPHGGATKKDEGIASLASHAPTPAAAPATPNAERTPPVIPAPITSAAVNIRIGNSFADVLVDGRRYANRYQLQLALEPGPHELIVERPGLGRFRPRRLLVDPDGAVVELRPDGTKEPIRGELMFPIPNPKYPDSKHPDWISTP